MNKKPDTIFTCSNCDAQYQKWIGRCLECGQWGTIAQSISTAKNQAEKIEYPLANTTRLSEIKGHGVIRKTTEIKELDRVLGNGLVPGSLILLGGEPGIGKSTLALQLATSVSPTLYFSGEESVAQIKLRADRMKIISDQLLLANENHVESICQTIKKIQPNLAIIDSIQTIYSSEIPGESGNANQIKAAAVKLLETAKSNKTAIVIIGHVTKEGMVAGPKTLEHLVDTVLYLEGDRYHSFRILRTVKNRFGPTDEVGVFSMTEKGLEQVDNPSAFFLADRGENMPGSIITCLMEGTRPLLVEIQALVNKTVFGYPVRKASGFDINRLHVLTAVLQKRAGLNLSQSDIHLNVVNGITANEPAVDLAVCLAIASAFKDKALGIDLAVFGEVGLGGEVRPVTQTEKRIKECTKLGMKRIILANSPKKLSEEKIKILKIKNLDELIKHTH